MVLRNGYLQFIFALLRLVGLFAYTPLSVYFMFTPMRVHLVSTSYFYVERKTFLYYINYGVVEISLAVAESIFDDLKNYAEN